MKNEPSFPRKLDKKKIHANEREHKSWSPYRDGSFQEAERPSSSDAERMSDFLETGDMGYLTKQQADEIKAAMAHTENSYDKRFLSEIEKQTGIPAEQAREQPLKTTFQLLIHQDEPRYVAFMRDYGDILYEDLVSYVHDDPQEFASLVAKQLDFKHPQSFATASRTLELLRNFYIEMLHREQDDLDVDDFHGDLKQTNPEKFAQLTESSTTLIETLKHIVERGEGSYLLHERARDVYRELTDEKLEYEDVDAEPFQLAPGIYAGFNSDKSRLYIAPQDANKRIEEYLHLDEKEKDARHYDVFYSDIIDAGHVLDTTACAHMGFAVNEQDLRDFYFLQSEPMRRRIDRDFEIRRSNLSISEQFQLLNFLKTVEKKDASPLLLQATRKLREMGSLDLNLIRDSSLEIHQGGALSEHDVEKMLAIQEGRYENKYFTDEFIKLRSELTTALAKTDVRFYLYRKGHEIVTFVRFDASEQTGDMVCKHMASFLTNPDFDGGALGQAMLAAALEKETTSGASIYAECDPGLAVKYAEFGFRIAREEYIDKNGEPTVDILLTSKQHA